MFQTIYGNKPRLIIENPADAEITVKYKIYTNSRCSLDGGEKMLGSEVTKAVPAGGVNFTLDSVSTSADDMPCGAGQLTAQYL